MPTGKPADQSSRNGLRQVDRRCGRSIDQLAATRIDEIAACRSAERRREQDCRKSQGKRGRSLHLCLPESRTAAALLPRNRRLRAQPQAYAQPAAEFAERTGRKPVQSALVVDGSALVPAPEMGVDQPCPFDWTRPGRTRARRAAGPSGANVPEPANAGIHAGALRTLNPGRHMVCPGDIDVGRDHHADIKGSSRSRRCSCLDL